MWGFEPPLIATIRLSATVFSFVVAAAAMLTAMIWTRTPLAVEEQAEDGKQDEDLEKRMRSQKGVYRGSPR